MRGGTALLDLRGRLVVECNGTGFHYWGRLNAIPLFAPRRVITLMASTEPIPVRTHKGFNTLPWATAVCELIGIGGLHALVYHRYKHTWSMHVALRCDSRLIIASPRVLVV